MLINPFLYWADRLYNCFVVLGNHLQSLLLLYMRLTWGHQFFMTGIAKLRSIQEVAQYFTTLHIPYPLEYAYLVGFFETIGGVCLFLGFASRIAAIPLAAIMFAALSFAHASHISNFRFLTDPLLLVRQEPYPFLITALLVFVFGPGRISLDAWIKRWVERQPKW